MGQTKREGFTTLSSPENPYDAPQAQPRSSPSSPVPLLWSVTTVFGSTIIGGVIGLGIGAALGAWVPSYYRSVFSRGSDADFDPLAVGIGQGLTQGLLLGAGIGLVIVAMFYGYRLRSARIDHAHRT